jgi:hypothetical protein
MAAYACVLLGLVLCEFKADAAQRSSQDAKAAFDVASVKPSPRRTQA